MMNRYYSRGVTLIELVAFIVIISVVVAGLVTGISTTLKGSGTPKQMTQALQLAQERMDLIRAQREKLGFAAFTSATYDPCVVSPAHPACTTTLGYTVTPALDTTGACMGDANYKCITVTASGPDGTLAVLSTAVGNY